MQNIETDLNAPLTQTLAEQLSRTEMATMIWRQMFPDFALQTDVVARWVMVGTDKQILKAFKRTYSKQLRFPMDADDCAKYVSSVIYNEQKDIHQFDKAGV